MPRKKPTSTILIADDDRAFGFMLQMTFGREGVATVYCATGDVVVEEAERNRPDIAILDHLMPGKRGLDVVRELRSRPEFAELPIVMVTGMREIALQEELIAAGADEVIPKPVSPRWLRGRINELLTATAH